MPDQGASDSREERIEGLLALLHRGEPGAMDQLFPLIYDELHTLAHRQCRRLAPMQTLDTTALLHEFYLRFANRPVSQQVDRAHFYALASRAMRHLLIDYARRGDSAKRGAGLCRATLDGVVDMAAVPAEELLAIDQALLSLEGVDERLVRLVEMHFFGGMTNAEIARVLDVSERTVKRDWRKAKALLFDMLLDSRPT